MYIFFVVNTFLFSIYVINSIFVQFCTKILLSGTQLDKDNETEWTLIEPEEKVDNSSTVETGWKEVHPLTRESKAKNVLYSSTSLFFFFFYPDTPCRTIEGIPRSFYPLTYYYFFTI